MVIRVFVAVLLSVAACAQVRSDNRDLLNRGVVALQQGRHSDAIAIFEQVVAADPASITARLYLGSAYMATWIIPGGQNDENADMARRAREQFEAVAAADPKQESAPVSLALLAFTEAQAATDAAAKTRALDDAARWNRRVLDLNPRNNQAWYYLGVIAWMRAYPEFQAARSRSGMKLEDPGPLSDFNSRSDLSNRFGPVIAGGIKDLEQALANDPQYEDAIAYLNLLYRLRADLADTSDQYYRYIARADEFVNRALELKRAKSEASQSLPSPPPPPPGGTPTSPQRIRVGGNVQAANLLYKVTPVYPQEAKDARIQGAVRFVVLIGKDGRVLSVRLVSGHPLLVPPAQDAVCQWVYKPTLLNGQPVEVVTQIEVNFTLSQ